jgi:hypothetical protein
MTTTNHAKALDARAMLARAGTSLNALAIATGADEPRGGNCVPRAMAALYVARYGCSAEFAYAWACRLLSIDEAYGEGSGTNWRTAKAILRRAGFQMEYQPRATNGVKTFLTASRKYNKGCYTLLTLNWRHVAAMVDGSVLDWADGRRLRLGELMYVTWN